MLLDVPGVGFLQFTRVSPAACGGGHIDAGDSCGDGNFANCDGCDVTCR